MTEREGGAPAARGIADWLSLAAAPVFALMALLTATSDSAASILCGAAIGGAPWHGMTLMYTLMSVFHAAPWLKLLSQRANRLTWTAEPCQYNGTCGGMDLDLARRARDSSYEGNLAPDRNSFTGGWRPNPGADESANASYDVKGTRIERTATSTTARPSE